MNLFLLSYLFLRLLERDPFEGRKEAQEVFHVPAFEVKRASKDTRARDARGMAKQFSFDLGF